MDDSNIPRSQRRYEGEALEAAWANFRPMKPNPAPLAENLPKRPKRQRTQNELLLKEMRQLLKNLEDRYSRLSRGERWPVYQEKLQLIRRINEQIKRVRVENRALKLTPLPQFLDRITGRVVRHPKAKKKPGTSLLLCDQITGLYVDPLPLCSGVKLAPLASPLPPPHP